MKEEGEEVIEPWQGRIRGIKTDIDKIAKNQESWELEVRQWQKNIDSASRKAEQVHKNDIAKLMKKSNKIEAVRKNYLDVE